MKTTNLTLLKQLKFSPHEIERRKEYLDIDEPSREALVSMRGVVRANIDNIVERFYDRILSFDEMDRVIGDAETLHRLRNYQRQYILSMFDGEYSEDYVHSRLRVGVVHKRIGVDPKYYVAAIFVLKDVLCKLVDDISEEKCEVCRKNKSAIDKLIMFDLLLAFDTYIFSLMTEAQRSNDELETYTDSLEEVIAERTRLLVEQARNDGLTGLLNQRAFYSELKKELLRGQRRNHAVVLVYFDLDGFKALNDEQGHTRGDEVLVAVGDAMRETLRETEVMARYGGDEFCIVLSDITLENTEGVCRRLCESIEQKTKGTGVTCSMGVAASTPEESTDVNSLVKAADKKMYEAKKEPGFSIKMPEA
ncbi:GGDEF domain-containing protein [Desulfoluna spongiiphila]|uniref:GGDEF domain-containing protein n=1 Tax=Desulfoluna spongiiphila TaxID=419481 RepID=UPI001253D676|nr:GGDEF domain-containing protein [Desulfoluna spongiiphila]VVS95422.1 globin/protoglobin [Desulfoluna spongiiphila]